MPRQVGVLVDGPFATFHAYDQQSVDRTAELSSLRVGDTLVFTGTDGSVCAVRSMTPQLRAMRTSTSSRLTRTWAGSPHSPPQGRSTPSST